MNNEPETCSQSRVISFGESWERVLYYFNYLFLLLVTKNIEPNERLFHSANFFSLMQTEQF